MARERNKGGEIDGNIHFQNSWVLALYFCLVRERNFTPARIIKQSNIHTHTHLHNISPTCSLQACHAGGRVVK